MSKSTVLLQMENDSKGLEIKITGNASAPEMCLLANELFESGLKEIMNPAVQLTNLEKAHLLSDTITLFKVTINSAVSGELFKKDGE